MTSPEPRRHRIPLFAALVSWLVICVLTSRSAPGLHYYDPVMQLSALVQHVGGDSPAWNALVRTGPADLAADHVERIGWWAPALPLSVWPGLASGLSLGQAIHMVFALVLLAGACGWALWLRRFPLPLAWMTILAALLPWLRPATSGLFRFSGDFLAWCAAPWLFIVMLTAWRELGSEKPRTTLIGLCGLAIGSSYLVKYSLFVVAAAGLVVLAARALRRGRLLPIFLLSSAMALCPVVLKIHLVFGGAGDPLGAALPKAPLIQDLGFALANPILALADAGFLAFFALVHPGIGMLGGHDQSMLIWVGLPGAAVLAWLVRDRLRSPQPDAVKFPLLVLPVFSLLMLALWRTSDVAQDARLFTPVAQASLPAVLALGLSAWSERVLARKAALMFFGAAYVAIPLGAGATYAAAKLAVSADSPAPNGLNLPALPGSPADWAPELSSLDTADTLWIADAPEAAFFVPGRFHPILGGNSIGEDLRNIYSPPVNLSAWKTSRPLTLRYLGSENSDQPHALLLSLKSVSPWTKQVLAGGLAVWSATWSPPSESSPRR